MVSDKHNFWYFRVSSQNELKQCVLILREKHKYNVKLAEYIGHV